MSCISHKYYDFSLYKIESERECEWFRDFKKHHRARHTKITIQVYSELQIKDFGSYKYEK